MAGWKRHFWYIRHIPCIQYDSSRIRVFLQSLNNLGQLVHPLPLVICMIINIGSSEVSPLEPIHRSQIALLSVLESALVKELSAPIPIPDVHIMFAEGVGVGVPLDEPDEFFHDTSPEGELCGETGEGLEEIVSHGCAKKRNGPSTCSISLLVAFLKDSSNGVKVLHFLVNWEQGDEVVRGQLVMFVQNLHISVNYHIVRDFRF